MHKRKRRSELSYVVNPNLGVGVSFKDNTVMSLDSIKTVRGVPKRDVSRGPTLAGSEQFS